MPPESFEADLKELHLDPKNPRLIGDFGGDEKKMFRYLITDIGVDDLLQSISTIGFIDGDPFIVRERDEGGYFVVEGNRRLAALKLLIGETPEDGLPLPPVPAISPDFAKNLEKVNAQIGWTEELLQAYLGYKHVTAAREWPPEAKAKFVFEHAKGDYGRDNLTKFAKTLGTNYATLKRWLVAYLTLREAENAEKFDPLTAPSKRYFGTFYTLLGGAEAKAFLSLQDEPISETPVPPEKLSNLSDFIAWTIGTRERPAQVNSRQQAKFERVLTSEKALQYFRVKGDLEGSLLYTDFNAGEVAGKLRDATYSVEECLPKLNDVRTDETVIEAFEGFERAYEKARLNMQDDQLPRAHG
jgi:hypothetical protein